MAGPWINAPLCTGPTPGTSYDFTISGLSASTIYNYRAYMVVCGIEYTGCTYQIATSAAPIYGPTVVTGTLNTVSCTCFSVANSCVTNKGTATPITQYGILFSQSSYWGADACLKYENLPTIGKVSTCADIGLCCPFGFSINPSPPLVPNTMTYYRAFLINNGCCCGYGTVCCVQTLPVTTTTTTMPPNIDITVNVNWGGGGDGSGSDGNGFCGAYHLRCCNGGYVCSKCLYSICGSVDFVIWTAAGGGCYFVDFAGVDAVCNWMAQESSITWNDSYSMGSSKQTECFGGDNNISAMVCY